MRGMMRMTSPLALCVSFGVACGGGGSSGPQPLVPDPAVVTTCAPGPVAAGATRAKPIACAEELLPGRLAAGRVGDLLLENERVRVVIRARGEGYYLAGSQGGGIVDAAAVGGEDLIKELLPAVDFAVAASDELVITEAGDDGAAEIVLRGPAIGLDILTAALALPPPAVIVEQRYRLPAGDAAVEIETRVFPADGGEPIGVTLYDALFTGGRVRAFLPGTGFVEGTGTAAVIASDGTTSSYGIVYPAGGAVPELVDLAGIRLVDGPEVSDAPQSRWLVIGDGSVASVTEVAWGKLGIPLGTITGTATPGALVGVYDLAEAPQTIARADAAGMFRVAVPAGTWSFHDETPGRERGTGVPGQVAAGGTGVTPMVTPGRGGTLAVTVRDADGLAVPARISVARTDGGDARTAWVDATGTASIPLPPADWRVSVSRGLEYDAFVAAAVTITNGQATPLDVELERVVDTDGWIALDTHLHSELSTDSTFPVDDRLRGVAAEGIDVAISTDHDFITDYAPIIAEIGLADWLASMPGEEASSLVWGHLNAWPLVHDPARNGAGAVRWLARTPGEVFASLRGGQAGRVVQVNHARKTGSLFDAIDFDPITATARRDPTDLGLPAGADLNDLSFDALEVCNASEDDLLEELFVDWLGLLANGHRITATGSSDSHGPTAYAGEARTYVWVGAGNDTAVSADPVAINQAIHDGHVVVSTGAFVTATIGSGIPGDTVDVPAATPVTLRVRVQAPPWQGVARLRVFQGTDEVETIALDPDATMAVRYDDDVVLPAPTGDTFYVVRVDLAGAGDPVINTSMPSLTNPIYVHVLP
jgi:hypothetical protein